MRLELRQKAKEITCGACNKVGHFQKFCRSRGKIGNKQYGKPQSDNKNSESKAAPSNSIGSWAKAKGNTLTNINLKNSSLIEKKLFYRINSNNIMSNRNKWIKQYRINGEIISFKIDTGSDVNCIPMEFINKLNLKCYKKTEDLSIYDYSKNKIK